MVRQEPDAKGREGVAARAGPWAGSSLWGVVPAAVLGVAAWQEGSLLLGGVAVTVLLGVPPVWKLGRRGGRGGAWSLAVVCAAGSLAGWAWPSPGPWLQAARGVLLAMAAAAWAVYDLQRRGAEPLRRQWRACQLLERRRSWPTRLEDSLLLPEVQRLRQSCEQEAEIRPVLLLLRSPRPPLVLAALHALEQRQQWRAGEAEYLVQTAGSSPHVPIRIALIRALAYANSAEILAALCGYLRDPAAEVRREAFAALLLCDGEVRWAFVREAVRDVLADPLYPEERPLAVAAGYLPAPAVADLMTWAAEPPPLSPRAILGLIDHYDMLLRIGADPEIVATLTAWVVDGEMPPAFRVELAALLRDHELLSPELLDRLSNADQPAPIRLFAAEMMLRINPHDPDGIDVLRGLARQSNRELALQVALILQAHLGLDFGLNPAALPAPNSKGAAELIRRLLQWANQSPSDPLGRSGGGRPPAAGADDHILAATPPAPPAADPEMDESRFLPLDQVLSETSSSSRRTGRVPPQTT